MFEISAPESIETKSGKPFVKQTMVLDITRIDPNTGEKFFPTYVAVEFANERCEQLAQFKVGDDVKVDFEPQSRQIATKTGKMMWMTSCRGWRVTSAGQMSSAPVQAPQQNFVGMPKEAPKNQPQPITAVGGDDLPF